MSIISSFSEKLNGLMIENNVSPDTLSKIIDIDLSQIYRYIRGEYTPSTQNAILIANYFKCSLAFLIGVTEESVGDYNVEHSVFYIRFRSLLEKNNISRYKIKKENLFAKQSIDDWFNGIRLPSIENLVELSDYFDCTIDYLVGRE